VLDHLKGELLARIVGRVFCQEPAQKTPASAQLVAEAAVIHRNVLVVF
jgi:hypothetical protein